jgi:hypothetical protein
LSDGAAHDQHTAAASAAPKPRPRPDRTDVCDSIRFNAPGFIEKFLTGASGRIKRRET